MTCKCSVGSDYFEEIIYVSFLYLIPKEENKQTGSSPQFDVLYWESNKKMLNNYTGSVLVDVINFTLCLLKSTCRMFYSMTDCKISFG